LAKRTTHKSVYTKAHRVMILVTGSTGLVGSHLLFELAKESQAVRALYRSKAGIESVKKLFAVYAPNSTELFNSIEWVACDITDYQSVCNALVGVKTVYHCAAMVSFNPKNAEEMIFNNVQGTANVVDASIAVGIEGFCHISSIAALGDENASGVVDETCGMGKLKRRSAYSRSKFFSENEVWRGVEMGLHATIVNPSVIIGPGSWSSGSGLLFSTVSKGFPFYTLGISGYVDVRDVAAATIQLTKLKKWGNRYVLNSENLSHRAVFSAIASELNKKQPHIHVKPWMALSVVPFAWIVSRITGKQPLLTRDTAKSGHSITYYSSKKITDELSFTFTPVKDAIKHTAKIFKSGLL